MSEMDTAAPAESAPQSTTEIAATVVSQAESAETSSESSDARIDTTNAAEETTPAKTEPTQAELTAAAKFLQKMGHKAKTQDGRDTWLKYTTVEKMLDHYVGDHRSSWDTEKQTLQQQATQAKEYQAHLDQLRAAVSGDPRQFLSELANVDPRYAAFLQQQAERSVADDRPKPDVDLGNGRMTYSEEGIEQLLAWKARQEIDARLKPIEEREKQAQLRAQQEQVYRAMEGRATQQLEDAQTWPGWAEHEADILKALAEDSAQAKATGTRHQLTLDAAYRKVVVSKLIDDDTKKRERLLKEINATAKSTAVSRQNTDAPKAQGPRSTQDIVRATVNQLENLR